MRCDLRQSGKILADIRDLCDRRRARMAATSRSCAAPAAIAHAVIHAELHVAKSDAGERRHAAATAARTVSTTCSASSSVKPGNNGSDRQPR